MSECEHETAQLCASAVIWMVAFINALCYIESISLHIYVYTIQIAIAIILIKLNTLWAVWQFDIIIIYFESRSLNYVMRCVYVSDSVWLRALPSSIPAAHRFFVRENLWVYDLCCAFFCVVDAKFHSITITRNKLSVKRVQEKYIMNFPHIHINLTDRLNKYNTSFSRIWCIH